MTQTVALRELVVVDDASTDDTAHILERLQSEYSSMMVEHNARRSGTPAARNRAVRLTSGDLIVVLDGDDLLTPGYLLALRSAIVDREWDFAYPDVQTFGAEDRFVPAAEFSAQVLGRENFITVSSMFRRELFDRVGGYDVRLTRLGFEDWDFWIRAVRSGCTGGPVHEAKLMYRRHETGSRNSRAQRRWRVVRVAFWWRHRGFCPPPRLWKGRRAVEPESSG